MEELKLIFFSIRIQGQKDAEDPKEDFGFESFDSQG